MNIRPSKVKDEDAVVERSGSVKACKRHRTQAERSTENDTLADGDALRTASAPSCDDVARTDGDAHERSRALIVDAIAELGKIQSIFDRTDNDWDTYEVRIPRMLQTVKGIVAAAEQNFRRNHLGRLQDELRWVVMQYLDLETLPNRLALASIDRSWRAFILKSKECTNNLWQSLTFHEIGEGEESDRDESDSDDESDAKVLIPPALKIRFSDNDLRRLLENVNAVKHSYFVRIEVGGSISGCGLAPILGSRKLEELEINLVEGKAREVMNGRRSFFARLLLSFLPNETDTFDEEEGFRLMRVSFRGEVLTEEEEHALKVLKCRMKMYWKPGELTCSHCNASVKNPGLLKDGGDQDNEMEVEVRPDWCCTMCFKVTCQQDSCPKARYCSSQFCFSSYRGPFCEPCEDEFSSADGDLPSAQESNCQNCQRQMCRHCAYRRKCFICSSVYCDDNSGEACQLNPCGRCEEQICSGCRMPPCSNCGCQVCCKKCNAHARFCATCNINFCGACVNECAHDEGG